MASIYNEMGGDKVLSTVVEKFYDRVAGDPMLSLHFEGADMLRIKAGFKKYIAHMLGADEKYEGPPLHVTHKGQLVTDFGFDSFVGLFVETLREAKLPEKLVTQIEQKIGGVKNDVVDSFQWPGTHFYEATRK